MTPGKRLARGFPGWSSESRADCSVFDERPGKVAKHLPPARLSTFCVYAGLAKHHFALFRHLLELDLDFGNTTKALWYFKGKGQRMRLVDSEVLSEVVNRTFFSMLQNRKITTDSEVNIGSHRLAVGVFEQPLLDELGSVHAANNCSAVALKIRVMFSAIAP